MSETGNARPTPDQLLAMMPFALAIGIELHEVTPTVTTGSLAWTPQRCTTGGILHRGAVMSLADTVGAVCAFLNLPEGAGTATIDSSTRLYRPVRGGVLRATARPAHVGRTVVVVATGPHRRRRAPDRRDEPGSSRHLAVTASRQLRGACPIRGRNDLMPSSRPTGYPRALGRRPPG